MSVKIKLKHSSVANKAPQPTDLDAGELALNTNAASPAAYIKDSAGNIVKLAGAGAIGGTPATETAAGIVELATAAETTTGTDATRAVHPAGLKVELDKKANQATTYTKTETDAALALKADLASPALTGTPTAPTAAAGTNTTQLATTAFVTDAVAKENLWDRTGTVVSPTTAGDDVFTTGAVKVGGTTAAPNIQVKADGGIVANTDGLVYDATNKRLGLGSSSPQAAFHLLNASGGTPAAFIENPTTTGDVMAGVRFMTHNGTSSVVQGDVFATSNSWAYRNHGANALVVSATGAGGAHIMASHPSGIIKFSAGGDSTGQERLRISASGAAQFTPGTGGVQLPAGATAWSPVTSESRLKDIIDDVDSSQCWDLVRDIKLKRYYYKEQDDKTGVAYAGPMADWLGQQDPELLIDTGKADDDGPIHTYNQGLLDMKALAALSLALKRIEELEAKVAALESKP